MKKIVASALFALSVVVGVEAAPSDPVTQADIQAILTRLSKLEAENKAQAAKIAELEGKNRELVAKQGAAVSSEAKGGKIAVDEGTEVSEDGKIFTTKKGFKYYLADASARIFEPLSESGLKITPYGYLVLEGIYSTRPLDCDYATDFVKPRGEANNTALTMADSILGIQFDTPQANHGWTFTGRAEFDLAGGNQNDYVFHWRHLYVNAAHESGWSILFGQTWHLWKMVTPNEIDGAWMENAGHPYRRSPQIRVTKKWEWEDSSLEGRVGIVKGGPGMGGDRDSDSVEDNTASPWVLFETAWLYDHKAAWQSDDRRWLIGLGGMYGRDRSHQIYADGSLGDEDDYDSMMGMIAASIPLWKFTLTGQFYGGENLGGIQAGCGQRVAYNNYGARGNEVRTIGGFIDLGYQINEKWSAAIGYGCDDPLDDDVNGSLNENRILFNDRIYIVAFYQILDNFKLGLEYARLMTSYADGHCYSGGAGYSDKGGDYDANRIQFTAFYDF